MSARTLGRTPVNVPVTRETSARRWQPKLAAIPKPLTRGPFLGRCACCGPTTLLAQFGGLYPNSTNPIAAINPATGCGIETAS